jgi:hypothetical protein
VKREQAVEIIERMKKTRPTCDKCETRPFTASLKEPDGPEGFEPMSHFAGYVKRCEVCAASRVFPWADKLTPEAVVAFVEREPWRDSYSWPLAEMKPIADALPEPKGFEFL